MGLIEVFITALALSVDAFVCSVISGKKRLESTQRLVTGLTIAGSFGFFQFLMPVIGFVAGITLQKHFASVDHWVAFVLLAFIGGKMLWEAFHEEDEGCDCEDTSEIDLREFLVLAVATSIDALAAGISFAALSVDIVPTVALIGVITFALSFAGVAVGHFFGARYEKPASIVGGVVLILIGLKVLLEHLGLL